MSRNAPIAIVAGVSAESYRRSDWRPERTGWRTRVIPGGDRRHGSLTMIWKRLLDFGDECADDTDAGVHFLLAHDRGDERPRFRRELRRRSFRAVWLDRRLSNQYGSGDFRVVIDALLEFEDRWRQGLRPDLNSPLLLPASAFQADTNVRDTWTRVQDVVIGRDHIDAVRGLIRGFVRQHRNPSGWIDRRRLLFRRGAPHGMHGLPAWRRQKLGFRLPDGFHFDVAHERQSTFHLSDQEGTRRKFDAYTNIDPHGFVRGGH